MLLFDLIKSLLLYFVSLFLKANVCGKGHGGGGNQAADKSAAGIVSRRIAHGSWCPKTHLREE